MRLVEQEAAISTYSDSPQSVGMDVKKLNDVRRFRMTRDISWLCSAF